MSSSFTASLEGGSRHGEKTGPVAVSDECHLQLPRATAGGKGAGHTTFEQMTQLEGTAQTG